MNDAVNVGRSPNVRDAAEHWMRTMRFVDDAARALFAVNAVMVNPRFAEHLLAEAARPLFAVPTEMNIGTLFVARVSESVRAGAQSDNRFAAMEIIYEMFHVCIRPFAKSQGHNAEIGRIECGETGRVGLHRRINRAVGG